MGLLHKVFTLVAKAETTPGTAISLAGTDGVFNVMNAAHKPIIGMRERTGQASFSPLPSKPTTRGGQISFEIEASGDGAGGVPPWASTFLPACGFVNSGGVFSPKSEMPGSNVKTLTIALYINGTVKKICGASGTFTVTMTTGDVAVFKFTFTGKHVARADAAVPSVTYPTISPYRFAAAGFAVGSGPWYPAVNEVSLDVQNQVVLGQLPGDLTGYSFASIRGRRIVGKMDPEASLVAAVDVETAWLNETQQAFGITLASSAETLAIAAPKMQFILQDEGDREGLLTDVIDFQFNKSSPAGNDDMTLTFAAA